MLKLTIVIVIFSIFVNFLYNIRYEYYYPYLLLLTSYREENLEAWYKYNPINLDIIYEKQQIPQILSGDYTYENLKKASNNFREPVVVRGMFSNTPATTKWKLPDYLPLQFDGVDIPIVVNGTVGTLQDERKVVSFNESFRKMIGSEYSTEYLFFPVKSRFTFNGSSTGSSLTLQEKCNEICLRDLELNKIWEGFATKKHTTFMGTQFIIGKSTKEKTKFTTGSDWHCAIGNNWFIQAVGRKRWNFVRPEHSNYMFPLKGGMFNMWTGNKNMESLENHIPVMYTDLEEGDLLYNPDWMWHKVTNYGGLSIGIPIREKNLTLSFQNNKFFTSIVALNKVLPIFGLSLGGFPPISAQTEHDN